jgi:hypothetical protein
VYPRERYIAYPGWGSDRIQAENAALGAIARYFEAEVMAVTRTGDRDREGRQESLAYIDREKAWVMHDPRAKRAAETLAALDPQLARRRAYTALARALRETLPVRRF